MELNEQLMEAKLSTIDQALVRTVIDQETGKACLELVLITRSGREPIPMKQEDAVKLADLIRQGAENVKRLNDAASLEKESSKAATG